MKKLSQILLAVLAVASVLLFSGCGLFSAKHAEKRLVEAGEFVSDSKYENNTLSIRSDKTYTLYIHSYETNEMETFEGKWSYVLTYKHKYTVTHDPLGLIKTTERTTWEIFKLDGYSDRGNQGYFVHKEYNGKIIHTDEEMSKNYFDQLKEENGSIWLVGWDMRKAPKD